METKIKMVKAVSAAISLKKNTYLTNEEIMEKVLKIIQAEKDEGTRFSMVAAASKSLEIAERKPYLKEKELIKLSIAQFNEILDKIDNR